MAGAPRPDDLAGALRDAGFEEVCIEQKEESKAFIKDWLPGSGAEHYVVSANVTARKPAPKGVAQGAARAHADGTAGGAAAAGGAPRRRSAARERWAMQVGLPREPAAAPVAAPSSSCCAEAAAGTKPKDAEARKEEPAEKAPKGGSESC